MVGVRQRSIIPDIKIRHATSYIIQNIQHHSSIYKCVSTMSWSIIKFNDTLRWRRAWYPIYWNGYAGVLYDQHVRSGRYIDGEASIMSCAQRRDTWAPKVHLWGTWNVGALRSWGSQDHRCTQIANSVFAEKTTAVRYG